MHEPQKRQSDQVKQQSSAAQHQGDSAPASSKPLTLPGAVLRGLVELHKDESSGLTPIEMAERIAARALGEKIAPGLYVSQLGSRAQFHLFKTPAASTFTDSAATQNSLLSALEKYQLVEGITPSKNALRVVTLLLRNLPGVSGEDGKILNSFRKEAAEVDLNKPANPDWKQTFRIQIGETSLDIKASLRKNSMAVRAISRILGSDLPEEARLNRYSYHFEIELSNRTKTEALRKTEYALSRAAAVGLSVLPASLAGGIALSIMPARLLPTFTDNSLLQAAADFSLGTGITFAACYAAYSLINTRLQRNRHK